MKRWLPLFLLTILAVTACQDVAEPPLVEPLGPEALSPDRAPLPGTAVVDRYIILLDRGVPDAAAAARGLAQAHGLTLRHTFSHALAGFSAVVPSGRLSALQRDPRVVRVEQVRQVALEVEQVPTGINRIEADRNPAADVDGVDDVRVGLDIAIIDSGIDTDHPDLNMAGGINFANGGADNFNDGNGHGTHVAGTTAAIDNGSGVVGVAPGARVWAVRVCGNSGFCFTDDMVAGIDWVAERKTSGAIDFASANMSITTADDPTPCTGSSDAVHEAICGVVSAGVVFSLAAGNDGRLKEAFPEALAVSAMADFDGRGGALGAPTCRSDEDESLANFSNYGSTVDIAAPGVCILSTWNDGGTNVISGTSMAAPHAAGAVALYLHANNLAPAQDGAGVDAIESAILNAALSQGDPCGFTHEHAADGSDEPLLFTNAAAFGGDGSCDDGSGTADPTTVGGDGGEDPPAGDFSLEASTRKVRGDNLVDLSWGGATSTDVDVLRNGALIATTPNDGSYTDNLGKGTSGSFTYQVCEAGTSTCSNEATVTF